LRRDWSLAKVSPASIMMTGQDKDLLAVAESGREPEVSIDNEPMVLNHERTRETFSSANPDLETISSFYWY
jgi:hypothetical protein